jgi:hypothetical protein
LQHLLHCARWVCIYCFHNELVLGVRFQHIIEGGSPRLGPSCEKNKIVIY